LHPRTQGNNSGGLSIVERVRRLLAVTEDHFTLWPTPAPTVIDSPMKGVMDPGDGGAELCSGWDE
jgi:hypothetical protein